MSVFNPYIAESDKQGLSLESLISPVQLSIRALDTFIFQEISNFEPQIQELVRYCITHQGKKLRPLLVFYSGWQPDHEVASMELLRAATIVEFVHIATLVHDDVLDNATTRHKAATISAIHGNTVAVLLGDALFAHAMKLASDFPTVEVCHQVSLATRKVCVGEIEQTLLHRSNFTITLEDYLRVIEYKTAGLFEVSCYLGALLGGYSIEFAQASRAFGQHLGIAYQILDDLIDIWGTESSIGKTLGTDITTGKLTLPLLFLRDKLEGREKQAFEHFFKASTARTEDSDFIRELNLLFVKYRILEQCQSFFLERLQKANQALTPFESLPPTLYLRKLSAMIETMLKKLV